MNPCKSCYYQKILAGDRICGEDEIVSWMMFGYMISCHRVCTHREYADAETGYQLCSELHDCKNYVPYKKMADTYRIMKITDRNGNDKKSGRYALRIGRLCKEPMRMPDGTAMFYYLENADGSDYAGMTKRTSSIERLEKTDNGIVLETMCTVYYLKREKPE